MLLQTQAKSVVAQVVALPTASVMQGREQAGKMLRSWAETAAARARMAVVYFIVMVVFVLFCWRTAGVSEATSGWLVWSPNERDEEEKERKGEYGEDGESLIRQ
jgi:hypothetical protein